MALFDGGNDPRSDLATLADATRDALAATSFDGRFRALAELVGDGVAWRTLRHLRAQRLPPAALVLAGAAGAIGDGKRHAVRPAWDAALALRRGRPPVRDVRSLGVLEAEIDELESHLRSGEDGEHDVEQRMAVACAERWVAELLAKRGVEENLATRASIDARLEDARWELAEAAGFQPPPAPAPALVRAAVRVAPIGAGGASLAVCADDRATLHDGRSAAPAWEGLCLAIDACGGGSHAALDALARFARTHEALGWPLWLDEVSCAFAGHPRRDDAARRLDARLAADPCAEELFARYRAKLETSLASARDVWLTLPSRREPRSDPPGDFVQSIADERARIDAGLPGRLDREYFRVVERTLAHSMHLARIEEERSGPFYDLRIDPPLERCFDAPLDYLVSGFRALYGVELAREALAALAN